MNASLCFPLNIRFLYDILIRRSDGTDVAEP